MSIGFSPSENLEIEILDASFDLTPVSDNYDLIRVELRCFSPQETVNILMTKLKSLGSVKFCLFEKELDLNVDRIEGELYNEFIMCTVHLTRTIEK